MRVRVGDVIEPAALRRAATWPIVNFFEYISHGINDHTTMNPRYIDELMFQAGVKGMSERSELIPCT